MPVTLAYDDLGPKSGPPLVLVPGLSATRAHWMGFDARLAEGRRVIAVDNRGAGGSPIPDRPWAMADLATDVADLLDALDIASADVFGTSMGGMVAQELVLARPERVRRLVLGCTHHGGLRHLPSPPEVVELFAPGGSARRQGAEAVIRRLVELNLAPAFVERHAETVDRIVSMGLEKRMHPAGLWGQISAVVGFDVADRLGEVRVPTLVIVGDEDRFVPAENSRLVAAAIPSAELAVLPGGGHMFWVDSAGPAFDIVTRFLDT